MSVPVEKTYKLYIGGTFPRTESGRSLVRHGVNICRGSRKDLRNAVVAARMAFCDWSGRNAYNRGQILYRIAEILEGRKAQFVDELRQMGSTAARAGNEVERAIDRLVYYAGWSDKYPQVFSSVNPVASSHFNFSMPEPMGVVAVIAPHTAGLLGLVSQVAPAIVGGNTVVALASETHPLCAVTFGEVLDTSDVPGGVVNVLTGLRSELLEPISTHMDINAIVYTGSHAEEVRQIQTHAALNVKRVVLRQKDGQGPYAILDTQETKTTWHPIGY